MQISLNLTEATIQHLNQLPDPDSFVENIVAKAFKNQETTQPSLSKWALLADEIEAKNYFDGCSEQIKKDAQEVREGFILSCDK